MKSGFADALDTPEIRRRTERILELKDKQRKAQAGLSFIIADIGDELIATKARLDYKLWQRWLVSHVRFTVQSAENYMKVGRLRDRIKSAFDSVARVGPTALYRIAALPDALIDRLAKDPRLPDPKTGQLTPIEQMSEREIGRALEILRGKSRGPAGSPAPTGTRNALAKAALRAVRATFSLILAVNGGEGSLDAQLKRGMLDLLDELREAVLHWKAWVTPAKHKHPR